MAVVVGTIMILEIIAIDKSNTMMNSGRRAVLEEEAQAVTLVRELDTAEELEKSSHSYQERKKSSIGKVPITLRQPHVR